MTELPKPVYLTKEERAQIALKARQLEVEQMRAKQEQERKLRESLLNKGNNTNKTEKRSINHDSDGEISENDVLPLNEKEIKSIKERYMGTDKVAKKKREKKFNFDWKDEEDTFHGMEPPSADSLLFGKGRIAGLGNLKQRSGDDFTLSRKKIDNSHWTEKKLEDMEDRDWRILKEDYNISTKGGSIPHPIRYWDESGLGEDLLKVVEKSGYFEPTPIQRQSIPIALQNRDLIGVAETGSGKTAAFVLPMMVYIKELPKMNEDNMLDGPYAIVLAPTRELALQIEEETRKFAKPLGFHCIALVGGHSISEQSFNLRNGAEIVIATPGRLRDCIDRHIIALNQCHYVVMDEADRMVDMGFEADVNFILDSLPSSNMKPDNEAAENPLSFYQRRLRQTIMFSATMPTEVERIARRYLRKPAMIFVGNVGQAVNTVEQRVELISEERKKIRLLDILENGFDGPILIFANQKQKVDYIYKLLEKEGYKSIVLHGGKSQDQREVAISHLKSGNRDILVATDVAGRGLDIKDVSLVINYDMAKTIEDYTHRIGRTGRAGKSGVAITFLTQNDADLFYDLKQMILKSSVSKVPPELMNHEAAMRKPGTMQAKKKSEETIFK